MKKIYVIVLAVLCVSCSIRLKGHYADTNHFFAETNSPYEEVWSRVIDYFALHGIPISTIDKASGLIVSSKVSFVNYYTREVKGKPINPNAYVVIPTIRGGFGNVLEPNAKITGTWTMIGDWNVRIKNQNDRVIVNVNLINIDCLYSGGFTSTKIPIASTGVFEQGLIDYLTK